MDEIARLRAPSNDKARLRDSLNEAVDCMDSMMARFLDSDTLRLETKAGYRGIIERCKRTLKETRNGR